MGSEPNSTLKQAMSRAQRADCSKKKSHTPLPFCPRTWRGSLFCFSKGSSGVGSGKRYDSVEKAKVKEEPWVNSCGLTHRVVDLVDFRDMKLRS